MITPYGAKQLTDCYLPENNKKLLDEIYRDVPVIKCNSDLLLECDRIADGSMTPIEGFFTKEEIDAVIFAGKLLNGVYFPMPILLQVPASFLGLKQQHVLLVTDGDEPVGYIENASVFAYNLEILCKHIFGVDDLAHPGVNQFIRGGNIFIGGKLKILKKTNKLSKHCLSPAETRHEIKKRKWQTCVGFQTRNVPHRAHEYLQRIALEMFDGLLLHPIIGWKKTNDYLPEVVIEAYNYMINNVYPTNRVLLSGLQAAMRYAGPKEAVIHAIIRQNYGCTHFIVGRDHAGVGSFYGKYEAQKVFETVEQFLDISILRLKGPYYCSRCDGIATEHSCGHDESYHTEISGTFVRDMLLSGDCPPSNLIRGEIVNLIRKFEKIFIE